MIEVSARALPAPRARGRFYYGWIVLGVAENEIVGAGCVTVTVADFVIVPPGPLAVSV